jgi:vancomycin permeability regulator SanA
MRRRRIIISVLAGILILGLAPSAVSLAVGGPRISTVTQVAPQPVAIVFGAATYADGSPSPFLKGRLDLARELFDHGKVRAILVSGDNRHLDYNEPDAMRNYLIAQGVPSSKVVADYAGFDTYSTCVRARRIFGVSRATLVSQTYHLPRAITACRAVGVDAWGVGDDSAHQYGDQWWQGTFREIPGSAKLAFDLATNRQPVLGKPESGIADALKG